MRLFTAAFGLACVVAGCAAPPAPQNPNAVPNVLLEINDLRRTTAHIYVSGGPVSGAMAGQRTVFAITSDDRLVCTFQTAPDPNRAGLSASVTGHRLSVPGGYARLSAILGQAGAPTATIVSAFSVQTGTGPAVEVAQDDPTYIALMGFFAATPTPCWTFMR